ncbi:MAG: DUF494 family protein [Candidatus Eiseniibacteriota bacterium]
MKDENSQQRAARVLKRLAERLEAYLGGDDLAFDALGERLDEEAMGPDDLQAAAWMLRGLAEPVMAAVELEVAPGEHALRILSPEERAIMSPEAWGYLLELRRRGSLDASQIERVLDRVTESAEGPIDVATAREIATRVALQADSPIAGEPPHGEIEIVH